MSFQEIFGTDNGAFFDFDQFLNTEQIDGPVALTSSDFIVDKQQVTFEESTVYDPQSVDMSRQASSSSYLQSTDMSRQGSSTSFLQSTEMARQGSSTFYPQSTAMSRQPSSESEGSAMLDFNSDFTSNVDPTFGLDLDLLTGAAPPSYNFNGGAVDPTMTTTFGSGFVFPTNPADMSNIADLFKGQQTTFADDTTIPSSSNTAFTSLPTYVSPEQLFTSLENTPEHPYAELPGGKRKMSDSSSSSQPKKRGRPCKTTLTASSPCTKPKRQATKPSVAKPKAVVPQKYLRDGSAQLALGMSEERILAFPDFEALLLEVPAHLQGEAIKFGQVIEDGRRQAAESAQMNRAAKDAKLNGLADKVHRMEEGFRSLMHQGVISEAQYRQFVYE